MNFTSEDLMKSLGLEIGSRFKAENKIFEVYLDVENNIRCCNVNNSNNHFYIKKLIDIEIEVLPPVKHIGDFRCKDCDCRICQLKFLCENGLDFKCGNEETLYKILEKSEIKDSDKEIYDLLKSRLDKEV